MHADFWHARWRAGQIGFHQATVEAHLTRHWADLDAPPHCRVFVPLCGKSLDLLWLRDHGHEVLGVELADEAVQAFCMENGVLARRREIAGFNVFEAQGITLYRGDYFDLTPALLGAIGAVYDRAALISWSPELRAAYVEHLARLVPAGVPMLLICLEYAQHEFAGPPFALDSAALRRLCGRHFHIHELSRDDILANEPRLRARGVTSLVEVSYRLTRL